MFVLPALKPEEILIYLRKSRTDDPALSVSETVAKHEQMLDDWCRSHLGDLVPERNRFREVLSGETIAARPEVQKVLRLIEQPQFRAILIIEPQRLSRGDLEDIGKLSKLLRYTGTIVITLQYSYDLTDERDRDYFERELKRGNEFLEYSKRIMMNGRNLAAERGYYTGSREPYGYKKIFRRDGKRKYPTLEIVQEEAEIIRLAFQMYDDGSGATAICTKLNAIGSKPKEGKLWTPPIIYSMLDNPLYNGKIKWGARKQVKVVEDGEIRVHSPRNSECPVFEGKHEAIIDDAMWSAVRKRRDARNMPKVKVSKELQNPLSGLLWCSCGRMMIRRPYSGRCADRYQCPNQTYCGNASCTMDELHEAVSDAMRSAIADFHVQINAGEAENQEKVSEHIKILKSRLSEAERKEAGIWEKFAEGIPPKIFEELRAKVEKQKEDITAMIEAAEAEADPIDIESKAVAFSEALDAFTDPEIPASQKNALLKVCIERITYSRERGIRAKGSGKQCSWISAPMRLDIELRL